MLNRIKPPWKENPKIRQRRIKLARLKRRGLLPTEAKQAEALAAYAVAKNPKF